MHRDQRNARRQKIIEVVGCSYKDAAKADDEFRNINMEHTVGSGISDGEVNRTSSPHIKK